MAAGILIVDDYPPNLVNSIKYGAGRPIEVSVTSSANHARLAIRDQGIGIPERDHRRIFELSAAVDDASAAYRGLAGGGFLRIAIAGDSAGGGLALATAARMTQAAREGSVPHPAAVVAMSPWTDLALTGDSIATRATHDPLLTAAALESARQLYLGRLDPSDPRASPLHGDVAGLPPVLLHVGEDEILLDDARRYAGRLEKAGVVTELHVWEGMVHVFPANLALLHAAREALDSVGDHLRHNLVAECISKAIR